jgi:L-asparagine transporter-like permease
MIVFPVWRSLALRTALTRCPRKARGVRQALEHLVYVFFEYLTLLALIAVIVTLLFAASLVFVMVDEGITTIRRMARKTSGSGEPDELLTAS